VVADWERYASVEQGPGMAKSSSQLRFAGCQEVARRSMAENASRSLLWVIGGTGYDRLRRSACSHYLDILIEGGCW
jgi:hypothetical protein